MAGRHDRTGWMDELEHRLAPPDDGNLGPLPLEGVVDDHVDAEVVEVGGEPPGQLGKRPRLHFWDHLEYGARHELFKRRRKTSSKCHLQ